MPTSVMRGVNMFTFSPPTTLGEPSTLAELAEMKALGVEYMPVAIFLRQENATSSRVVVAKKETPTDDALRTFLSAAVAMGIKPMVCTHTCCRKLAAAELYYSLFLPHRSSPLSSPDPV